MTIFSSTIALGAVLGLIWFVIDTPVKDRDIFLTAVIWVLISALFGSRIAYVVINWDYFQEQIIETPQIWMGGLAWPGALAGGLLTILLVAWIRDLSLGSLADSMLPLLASLSVAVWLGCSFAGCAYGPVTEAWWGLPTPNEWGDFEKRLPLQFIIALLILALFWGIDRLHHRFELIPGLAACLGLGGLSLSLLIASILRADPYPMWNGIRLETWAALLFLGIALLSGGFTYLMSRR